MSEPKLRVAICGGGISGLCLAVILSKYEHIQVDIFEATEQFKEIGAGVMIWARTWRIIELMGLAQAFSNIAHAPPDGSMSVGFDYRRSDQPNEGFRFWLAEMPYGCIRFHRAQFLDVLVHHLPPGVAHFTKRATSYSTGAPGNPDPVIVTFADGATHACDVLVGCDGIKSTVRAQLLRAKAAADSCPELLDLVDPVWSGTIAYRGLVPVGRVPRSEDGSLHPAVATPMMYCGKGKHIVTYSISQGDILNVVTFSSSPEQRGAPYAGPWVTPCSLDELVECYAHWEPDAEKILKCIESPTRWAIHELLPLPLYTTDRVALIGDAAHAMAPHQGAGAGQAIEDAFILGNLLGHLSTTRLTLASALAAYDKVRLPAANRVLRGSHESGMMYEFNSEFGDVYEQLGPAIQKQWDWLWETTPEEDLETAINILRESS